MRLAPPSDVESSNAAQEAQFHSAAPLSSHSVSAGTEQRALLSCLPAILQTCTTRSTPPPRTDPDWPLSGSLCPWWHSSHLPASGVPLPPAVFALKTSGNRDEKASVLFLNRDYIWHLLCSKGTSLVGKKHNICDQTLWRAIFLQRLSWDLVNICLLVNKLSISHCTIPKSCTFSLIS